MAVTIKRAYDLPGAEDGTRVLVDRYWPRGVRKDLARIDEWMKELAPSPELISWFGHRPERWEEFKRRYWKELDQRDSAQLALLAGRARSGTLTLVYAARDEQHNNALALKEYLELSS